MEAQEQSQTQTQTQSVIWSQSQIESQPVTIVWGRLYGKNVKIKSLGMRKTRSKMIYVNTPFSVGNILMSFCLFLSILNEANDQKYSEFLFIYCILDLNIESFTVGRGETNDLILTLSELSEKFLNRISKEHFVIKRMGCNLSHPVYIKVKSSIASACNALKIYFIGSLT